MNIFVLDLDPVLAAQYQCDKHVVKMILESAQLLSTAHHELDSPLKELCYRPTHKNHPCAIWARTTLGNYNWLYEHFQALSDEYTRRYGKVHKTWRERGEVLFVHPNKIPYIPATQHPLCMPDQYKIYDDVGDADVVGSYRNYYLNEKAYFAKWKLGAPEWWVEATLLDS